MTVNHFKQILKYGDRHSWTSYYKSHAVTDYLKSEKRIAIRIVSWSKYRDTYRIVRWVYRCSPTSNAAKTTYFVWPIHVFSLLLLESNFCKFILIIAKKWYDNIDDEPYIKLTKEFAKISLQNWLPATKYKIK